MVVMVVREKRVCSGTASKEGGAFLTKGQPTRVLDDKAGDPGSRMFVSSFTGKLRGPATQFGSVLDL